MTSSAIGDTVSPKLVPSEGCETAISPVRCDADPRLPNFSSQLVTCRVVELRCHPSYVRHGLSVSTSQLSAVAARGDLTFRDPIVIARDRVVVDGYARWELARRQGREVLLCLEYELTEDESLECLIERHRRRIGLNSFLQILLALDLEPSIQAKARANQQAGGQKKGRSNLTGAQKVVVRSRIASAARTSSGSVTKVKQLLATIQPEIREALQRGETSIHRAWLWRALSPQDQVQALNLYRSKKGVGKAIREALSLHQRRTAPTSLAPIDLAKLFSKLKVDGPEPVLVIPVKVPGRTVFLTEELMEPLKLKQQESALDD